MEISDVGARVEDSSRLENVGILCQQLRSDDSRLVLLLFEMRVGKQEKEFAQLEEHYCEGIFIYLVFLKKVCQKLLSIHSVNGNVLERPGRCGSQRGILSSKSLDPLADIFFHLYPDFHSKNQRRREQWRQSHQQTSIATTNVAKLNLLPGRYSFHSIGAHHGRIQRGPVMLRRASGICIALVRVDVCMGSLPKVTLLWQFWHLESQKSKKCGDSPSRLPPAFVDFGWRLCAAWQAPAALRLGTAAPAAAARTSRTPGAGEC